MVEATALLSTEECSGIRAALSGTRALDGTQRFKTDLCAEVEPVRRMMFLSP